MGLVAIAVGTRVRVVSNLTPRHVGQAGTVVIGAQGGDTVVVRLDSGEESAFLMSELEVID